MNRNHSYVPFLVVASGIVVAAWIFFASAGTRSEVAGISAKVAAQRAEEQAIQLRIAQLQGTADNLRAQLDHEPGSALVSVSALPLGDARWNMGLPYVDLPKSFLQWAQLDSFSFDGELRSSVGSLLGISPTQADAVREIYDRIQHRSEEIDRARFQPTEEHLPDALPLAGRKLSFVIERLPAEIAALKLDAARGFASVLGETRAEFLARSSPPKLSISTSAGMDPIQRQAEMKRRADAAASPSWLKYNWETNVTSRITIVIDQQPEQKVPIYGSGGGNGNSLMHLSGNLDGIKLSFPDVWSKFLTQEMLNLRRYE